MLYTAAFWRPDGERPPIDKLLAHPAAAMFHVGWGRPGDTGLVAESHGRPVGAAWFRRFTDEVHGDGFIDAATPELAIAVDAEHRGRGIGRMLLVTIHDLARRDGITRISLSADLDNPARHLYRSVGYREVAPDDPKTRMVVELG